MNRRTIFIIIIVVAVAAGAYWYMNNGFTLPKMIAAPVPVPVPVPTPAPAPTSVVVQEEMVIEEVTPEPIGTHPLAGEKFIISSTNSNPIIVPVENDSRFKLDSSGARTDAMIIKFEPVEGQENTYFLLSKGLNKYIKYSNNGFGYRTSKPTTYHYKIKFTLVGENYAMSYINSDGKELFFGYDGEKMKSDESVTSLVNTGLVNFIDADVSGYVLPGNFGSNSDNFREYGPAEDDDKIQTIEGCITRLSEVDMDDEYRSSLLSVAFNKDADTPCRAYPQSDSYGYKVGATGWVTTCVDKSKDIKQGCLL
jgi:hypothetical protein